MLFDKATSLAVARRLAAASAAGRAPALFSSSASSPPPPHCELFDRSRSEGALPSAFHTAAGAMQRPRASPDFPTGFYSHALLPSRVLVEPSPANMAGANMASRSHRFGPPDRSGAGSGLGPGEYSTHYGSMAHSLSRNLASMSRAGAGFGTKGAARELLRVSKDQIDLPGPGAYRETALSVKGYNPLAKTASWPFKSASLKASLVEPTGDPGAYSPGTNRFAASGSVAGQVVGPASGSFARSVRNGAGAFGATAARSPGDWLSILGEDTPGPGAYVRRPRTAPMPSAAFRSSSAQRPRIMLQSAPG